MNIVSVLAACFRHQNQRAPGLPRQREKTEFTPKDHACFTACDIGKVDVEIAPVAFR